MGTPKNGWFLLGTLLQELVIWRYSHPFGNFHMSIKYQCRSNVLGIDHEQAKIYVDSFLWGKKNTMVDIFWM